MQANPSPRSANEREDIRMQRTVLMLVLSEQPSQLTICEIAREVSVDESDAAERSIRDLVGAGLLRCEGASVLPTRAAMQFDRIAFA
jgi:hypothetical protein